MPLIVCSIRLAAFLTRRLELHLFSTVYSKSWIYKNSYRKCRPQWSRSYFLIPLTDVVLIPLLPRAYGHAEGHGVT